MGIIFFILGIVLRVLQVFAPIHEFGHLITMHNGIWIDWTSVRGVGSLLSAFSGYLFESAVWFVLTLVIFYHKKPQLLYPVRKWVYLKRTSLALFPFGIWHVGVVESIISYDFDLARHINPTIATALTVIWILVAILLTFSVWLLVAGRYSKKLNSILYKKHRKVRVSDERTDSAA